MSWTLIFSKSLRDSIFLFHEACLEKAKTSDNFPSIFMSDALLNVIDPHSKTCSDFVLPWVSVKHFAMCEGEHFSYTKVDSGVKHISCIPFFLLLRIYDCALPSMWYAKFSGPLRILCVYSKLQLVLYTSVVWGRFPFCGPRWSGSC